MKRTWQGLVAMVGSFLLSSIVALGALLAMGGRLSSEAMLASPLSAPTLLIAVFVPWAILLEILAIVFVLKDSRKVGEPHRRFAIVALALFVLWAAANLGGFVPVTFAALRRGSLEMARAGQMIKASAALLQYAVPFFLAIGLARGTTRGILWAALIASVIGNFGAVVLTVRQMTLTPPVPGGLNMWLPRFEVDYTQGFLPPLLGCAYAGAFLYVAAYALLAARLRRMAGADPLDRMLGSNGGG
jgi:hypothetical protein